MTYYEDGLTKSARRGSLCALVVPAPLQPNVPLQIAIGRFAAELVSSSHNLMLSIMFNGSKTVSPLSRAISQKTTLRPLPPLLV